MPILDSFFKALDQVLMICFHTAPSRSASIVTINRRRATCEALGMPQRTDGWMDGRTGGRMDGWTDEQTDEREGPVTRLSTVTVGEKS